jgi:hypothetical protein
MSKTRIVVPCMCLAVLAGAGCAGIKVVKPNDRNPNAGALAVDWSGGQPKLVSTYTCKLDSMGNHFSAMGKTENEARNEVVARCHDNALLTFCKPEQASCVKN